MQGTECGHIGMAVKISEDTGEVRVLLALHEGAIPEDDNNELEPAAWVLLPPELALQIAQGVGTRAVEALTLQNEIQSTPPDDRQAKVQDIYTRLHSPFN